MDNKIYMELIEANEMDAFIDMIRDYGVDEEVAAHALLYGQYYFLGAQADDDKEAAQLLAGHYNFAEDSEDYNEDETAAVLFEAIKRGEWTTYDNSGYVDTLIIANF